MRYGYGRVSSRGQKLYGMSLEDQVDRLIAAGVQRENIYLDTYTGHTMERPGFDDLLSKLKAGDEMVVCKLDRFARTAPEGALLVRDLVDRGITVHILNMGIADNSPMGKVMVTVMLAFAEYERDMIVERTSDGKAYKREHDPNWREGRKPIVVDQSAFESCREKQKNGEMTVADCCRELGIGRTTWYELVRRAG
jgi:DNA invertase Pin-like site-specific DNA recombinase